MQSETDRIDGRQPGEDEERYYRLLIALEKASVEIEKLSLLGVRKIDEILIHLLPGLVNAVYAEYGCFLEYFEKDGLVRLLSTYPQNHENWVECKATHALKKIIRDGQTESHQSLLNDYPDPLVDPDVLRCKCALIAPIRYMNHTWVIGLINHRDQTKDPLFRHTDLMAVDGVLKLIMMGVHIGEEHQNTMQTIHGIAVQLNADLELDTLLPSIVEKTTRAFKADACSLMMWDKAKENLIIQECHNLSPRYKNRLVISKDLVMATVKRISPRKSLTILDLQEENFASLELILEEGLRSVLSTQLLVENEMIGVLNVYSKGNVREFFEDEINLAEFFANQVAIAIRNASRRKMEITGLLSTSKILDASFDYQTIFNLIVKTAQEVFKVAAAGLFLWDDEQKIMTIRAQTGLSEAYSQQQRLAADKAIDAVTVGNKYKPKVTPDLRKQPYGNLQLYISEGLQTGLSLPLIRCGKLLGILVLYSRDEPRRFSQEEIELAEIFANQSATAIELTDLHNQTMLGKEQAESRLKKLEDLQQVGERINRLQADQFKAYMDTIAREICQMADASSTVIYPYSLENNYYEIGKIGTFGLKQPQFDFKAKPRDEKRSMTRRVMQARQTIVVDDVATCWDRDHLVEIKEYNKAGKFLEREGVRAFIGIGLWVGKTAIGTLFVNFDEPRRFSSEEIERIEILSNQAAIAIQNARFPKHAEKDHKLIAATQQITQKIPEIAHSNEIWQLLLDEAIEIIEAPRGCVFVRQDDSSDFKLVAAEGYHRDCNHALRSAKLLDLILDPVKVKLFHPIITDTQDRPEALRFSQLDPPIGSLIAGTSWDSDSASPMSIFLLESSAPGAFENYDISLLEEIAVYGKVVVQAASAYQETRKNNLLQRSLVEAGQQIFDLDSEQVLKFIAGKLKEILSSDIVVLFTYNQAKQTVELPVYWGDLYDPQAITKRGPISQNSIPYRLLDYGRPYYADDVSRDPQMKDQDFVHREKVKSCAAIPLIASSEKIGILFVNYRAVHTFEESERRIIELFAQQAALAIQNARLYDESKKRTRHLETIHDASTRIVSKMDQEIEITFQIILEQAVDIVTAASGREATVGTIHLLKDKALVLKSVYPPSMASQLTAMVGDTIPLDPHIAPGRKIGITGKAVIDHKNMLVGDVSQVPDYITYHINTKSELAVLMKDGEQIIGVLNVESEQLNTFDSYDQMALEALADLAVASLKIEKKFNRKSRCVSPRYPPNLPREIIAGILSRDENVISPESLDLLLGYSFPQDDRVILESVQGNAANPVSVYQGRSIVMKAWPGDRQPVIIKITTAEKIVGEHDHYREFIEDRLRGNFRAGIRGSYSTESGFGSLVYDFMGADLNNVLPTFSIFYGRCSQARQVLAPLNHLFLKIWRDLYNESHQKLTGQLFTAYNQYMHLDRRVPDWKTTAEEMFFEEASLTLSNPIRWSFEKQDHSELPRQWQAITHGDLHGDNIFTDGQYAWLIDFERGGPGPILRDFVELEVDILTRLLELAEVDYTGFYELLICLAEPSTPDSPLKTTLRIKGDRHLLKALEVITGLRQLVGEVTPCSDFREYLWGLLMDAIYVASMNLKEPGLQQKKALFLGSIFCERLKNWGGNWPVRHLPPVTYV
jgi:GAF domain-containing protein